METSRVGYVTLTLFVTEKENEVEQFEGFIKRAYEESKRAGLKNTFEQDRPIIKKLVENLGITIEQEAHRVSAGDTHTTQQYNER